MKYILVTGANGGMGKAVVDALVSNGYTVFASDIALCAEQKNVIPIQADITDEQSVCDLSRKIRAVTDELCGIVHLAGIYMLDSLVEMPAADFEKIFRINVGGAFIINKVFRPFLKKGSSVIIVTSELAPRAPLPFTGIYGITKAALDKYAYSLRMELQLDGIKVSVLRAGAVDTGMLDESVKQLNAFCAKTERYKYNAERFGKIVDSVESRRISPVMIAKKILTVLESKNPRFAYSLNRNALLILFDALPSGMRFYIIRKILGSSDKNPEQR
jgi:NAD(P)-dependent dehydrogenase (short-subunit alcohol dehydrogenase family)